jgi:hypothetical protein
MLNKVKVKVTSSLCSDGGNKKPREFWWETFLEDNHFEE